jgi:hypothetical protein
VEDHEVPRPQQPSYSVLPQDSAYTVTASSRLDEQLIKVARWSRQRTGKQADEMPIVTPSGPDAAAKWFGIAYSVAKFGPVHSAVPDSELVLEMIKRLCGIEEEQSQVLHSIDTNVKLLKEGPFRTGRLLLSEAERVGDRDDDSRRMLESARDKFYDAQPMASSVQERALVEMHLGLVWLALGRHIDARYWLEQSYQSARLVIDTLTRQAGNVKVLKTKWATTALSIYYPAGLLVVPVKLKRLWNADRAWTALAEFLPFLNTIAACLNNLSTAPMVPALNLTVDANGNRLLQETGIDG